MVTSVRGSRGGLGRAVAIASPRLPYVGSRCGKGALWRCECPSGDRRCERGGGLATGVPDPPTPPAPSAAPRGGEGGHACATAADLFPTPPSPASLSHARRAFARQTLAALFPTALPRLALLRTPGVLTHASRLWLPHRARDGHHCLFYGWEAPGGRAWGGMGEGGGTQPPLPRGHSQRRRGVWARGPPLSSHGPAFTSRRSPPAVYYTSYVIYDKPLPPPPPPTATRAEYAGPRFPSTWFPLPPLPHLSRPRGSRHATRTRARGPRPADAHNRNGNAAVEDIGAQPTVCRLVVDGVTPARSVRWRWRSWCGGGGRRWSTTGGRGTTG